VGAENTQLPARHAAPSRVSAVQPHVQVQAQLFPMDYLHYLIIMYRRLMRYCRALDSVILLSLLPFCFPSHFPYPCSSCSSSCSHTDAVVQYILCEIAEHICYTAPMCAVRPTMKHVLHSSTKARTRIMLNISESRTRSPLTTSSTTMPEYHPTVGEPRSKQ
jgi:hypothetical protein